MMADDFKTEHWPTEIRLRKQEKILEIDFDDGSRFALPAELLRVESPSAEVQGHGPGQKTLIAGRRHVGIMAVEPVGNYAVRIKFDDLHDTGIFSWPYLYKLGRDKDQIWQGYLDALGAHGLSRDP
jgi:DUF971 family protein